MRLLHFSDTHGNFPRLYGRFDAVIHTGDWLGNSPAIFSGNKTQEAVFQMRQIEDNLENIKRQAQGRPYLFILGNHDFVHPQMVEQFLRSEGVQAIDLTDKVVSFGGFNFYGYPYIPHIYGNWNYERQVPEMQEQIKPLVETLNQTYIDILVCHAPIHGTLDLTHGNDVIGSTVIAQALDYQIAREMQPAYYLHGHCHEANGIAMRNGMLVSNMATTQTILEVK
jgi:Icc-related predicted phosphoesterase